MKRILILAFLFFINFNLHADERPQIYSLINKSIFVNNGWAGETFTLIKENNDFFIIRQKLRSGLPGGPIMKYQVNFYSDYQIRFSKIINSELKQKDSIPEEFILTITGKDKIELLLNGLEVVVKTSKTIPHN